MSIPNTSESRISRFRDVDQYDPDRNDPCAVTGQNEFRAAPKKKEQLRQALNDFNMINL